MDWSVSSIGQALYCKYIWKCTFHPIQQTIIILVVSKLHVLVVQLLFLFIAIFRHNCLYNVSAWSLWMYCIVYLSFVYFGCIFLCLCLFCLIMEVMIFKHILNVFIYHYIIIYKLIWMYFIIFYISFEYNISMVMSLTDDVVQSTDWKTHRDNVIVSLSYMNKKWFDLILLIWEDDLVLAY